MKQIFHHYEKWECYKNGMYKNPKEHEIKSHIEIVVDILGNKNNCIKFMNMVISEWKYSPEQNITNKQNNRRAYIGASCCNIENQITEIVTRYGWGKLSENQKIAANKIADSIIEQYEIKIINLQTNTHAKTLF